MKLPSLEQSFLSHNQLLSLLSVNPPSLCFSLYFYFSYSNEVCGRVSTSWRTLEFQEFRVVPQCIHGGVKRHILTQMPGWWIWESDCVVDSLLHLYCHIHIVSRSRKNLTLYGRDRPPGVVDICAVASSTANNCHPFKTAVVQPLPIQGPVNDQQENVMSSLLPRER